MKFVRQEKIITTICNEEISDIKTIKEVLENLLKDRIRFSISIRKYIPNTSSCQTLIYEKVKVKKVYDEKVDFIILMESSVVVLSDISFNDIESIYAITTKQDIFKVKPDADRFDLMELDLDDGI